MTGSAAADPQLAAALEAAGFEPSGTAEADLIIIDIRGQGEARLPDAVAAPGGLAMLLCDAGHAGVLAQAAPGITHSLVTPFAPAALALQLALIRSQLIGGADMQRDLHGQLAALARTADGRLHAMLIGLRRMSAINATYGAAVGDAALETIGQRLTRQNARLSGGAALTMRLSGGDYLLAHVMPEERVGWQVMAERLLRVISEPLDAGGHRLRLTARAALALGRADESPLSLLDRLSAGLAAARESAAEPVRWADRQSDNAPQSGYRLEQDIVRAIEQDEITVLFQPQFAVEDGAITGAEALARWQHPLHGEIGAGTLFAIADKADFTRALSRHIRKRAMEQAAGWTGPLANLRISLNVTAEDLGEKGFAQRELKMIAASGFDTQRLTLEMTESALIPDLKRAAARFATLREAGVRIAVDDFGTGYSSLLYLKRLPLDYLKLDHAMTRDIGGAEADRIIVRSIVAMAKALDLKVIAEGVESEAQLDALREEGCDYFQGFLRGKAMEAEIFAEFATAALSPEGERI
ncbi:MULTISPECIES: GGDEF domain-containing phosphodiesterase [Blastomonas]|uniref:GGDEF domain-containing phosphodiesterase n=1 Tax=Blastomonas TaxID=150203 RepID=UPI0006B92B01|nr:MULTISPECIES: GGDEF domain-containing phosphodiesterase [Blastomonas]MDM7929997.1 GGDEF domain-containing phosphodiesterase [Blastomonas fulva]MDM7966238.1 GGDEF domain-containing phosphodiesterase [Blastomonas fulva]